MSDESFTPAAVPATSAPLPCPLCGREAYATRTVNGTQMDLETLYNVCGITFATYQSIEINGGTKVVCRLCAKGNGEPHAKECGVGIFEDRLRSIHAAPPALGLFIARLRYWQQKKHSVDAVRPNYTADQMRELEAAESRLLACDLDELSALNAAPEGACQIRLELAERAYERLQLCSDHRDKADGRCIVCVAEERTRRELVAEGARPAGLPAHIVSLIESLNDWHYRLTQAEADVLRSWIRGHLAVEGAPDGLSRDDLLRGQGNLVRALEAAEADRERTDGALRALEDRWRHSGEGNEADYHGFWHAARTQCANDLAALLQARPASVKEEQ